MDEKTTKREHNPIYDKMTKEGLIEVIEALEIIRDNYEKKFGVRIYANGAEELILFLS